jgi:hypothetical protein
MFFMELSRQTARKPRMLGASAVVVAVAAILSGCYYRGRPPEYGRRGYDDHDHRHDHDHDHGRDPHY